MKELETHLNAPKHNTVELNVKKKQEIEYVLQGSLKAKAGHFVWEINEETGEIKKAEFKRTTAVFGGKIPPEKMVVQKGCVYIPALNAKNAKDKYDKNKDQSAYYVKPPAMNIDDIYFAKRQAYKNGK